MINLSHYSIEKIRESSTRIAPYIHKTPVLTSSSINKKAGATLYFKCENFQKIGAFKMRGAANAIMQLTPQQKKKGVITHSSGNHAQAVAKAASLIGIEAQIVMPSTAPKVKVEAVKEYGGIISFCEPTLAAREQTVNELIEKKGYTFIHPFDNENVILGQASCALEFLEQTHDLELIICPVGGGGLLAGTALSAYHFGRNIRVFAGEPEGADDAYRSLKAAKLFPQTNPNTIADGLLTSLGKLNFEVIKELVADIFVVNDDEIKSAQRLIWERMKIIIEPSCAVPLAAILRNKEQFEGQKIGVILSGGNVDLDGYFDGIKPKFRASN